LAGTAGFINCRFLSDKMALVKKQTVDLFDKLPALPGVYEFLNAGQVPIYIGKAVNLKRRIKQHFSNRLDPKEKLISSQTVFIRVHKTELELEALLLEANLIRRYQPKYNLVLLDDKSRLYIVITKETYPKVRLMRQKDLQSEKRFKFVFGPLASVNLAKQLLRKIRQAIPFCTEKKMGSKPCFYSQIGLCSPCPNDINIQPDEIKKTLTKQYQNNIRRLIHLLQGKGEKILAEFKKELEDFAKEERYEEAAVLRNRFYYLQALFYKQFAYADFDDDPNYLHNLREKQVESLQSLLKLPKLKQVECYDLSNLNFKEATASMVVFVDAEPRPDQYRRFKIRGRARFDPEMMLEIIRRRFNHRDWPKPDLIVIDGGMPQLLMLHQALGRIKTLPLIVGLAKNPDRLVLLKDKTVINFKEAPQALTFLQRMRDEAHRFAKKYHLLLRRKALSKMLNEVK